MCGITGFFQRHGLPADAGVTVERMAAQIVHRGPDDCGVWLDASAGMALGHRRLSILDLSPQGHQPMLSACGRYVMVFNGEIYNHADLRRELEASGSAPAWRGHADTEVMLAVISRWGLATALEKFVGMFALALWDRHERKLYLVRDRLGEKPLYYGWRGEVFLFGSELKALRAHPAWTSDVDRDALALFLRHNYIPAPYSIYRGVSKLLPGTWLCLDAQDLAHRRLPEPCAYWSAREVAEQGGQSRLALSDAEAVDRLDALLRDAIRQQMVADVPLGAFLSGGIDSSLVVALMQAQSAAPVRTFTIGFHEREYNEAEYARAVARHLGTSHTELYVTPEDARAVIPGLPQLFDEPFADSSQIPTLLVSRLARQQVAVSLSGDGGDELFGGYNRYALGQDLWHRMNRLPLGVRRLAAQLLRAVPPRHWDGIFRQLRGVLPGRLRQSAPGDKLHKLAAILEVRDPEQLYHGLVSHWEDPASVVLGATEPASVLTDPSQWAVLSDFTERMMYLDTVSYLPGDILTKVDRAAMSVSLETRIPLLDHRVVEFAWRLPLSMKIRHGQSKWLLRQVLYHYVPAKLIERPKMGFGVPIDTWLRGPLREWAESLLNESRLKCEGYFDPAPIRAKWAEHLSGQRNWQYPLWDVLMFQAWLEAECRPTLHQGA